MCKSIVFLGDSITDAGRTYPTVSEYGYGFAAMCIERLKEAYPLMPCYNRGVAGQTIGQIFERFEADCLSLNPCVVTMLMGVNDVNYSYRHENAVFEKERIKMQLEHMFSGVKQAGAQLIVLQPYAFEGELYLNAYQPRLSFLQATTKALGEAYADAYVDAHLTKEQTIDGVHPTKQGHQQLAGCWMKAFDRVYGATH